MRGQHPIPGLNDSGGFQEFAHLSSMLAIFERIYGEQHRNSTRSTACDAHIRAIPIVVFRAHIMGKSLNCFVADGEYELVLFGEDISKIQNHLTVFSCQARVAFRGWTLFLGQSIILEFLSPSPHLEDTALQDCKRGVFEQLLALLPKKMPFSICLGTPKVSVGSIFETIAMCHNLRKRRHE